MPAKKAISPRSQPVKMAIHLQSTKINKNPFVTCAFRPGLKAFEALLEGLHAKRAYIAFLADFHFLQDRADFWQTDLF